ncbi:hypothetical protein GQF03_01110 [Sneathiella chungangensis]|uniref:Uncharacterized protein n=1 Tax=Sneathiella chungangensis TaxID=1418234 RepID=A0A845M9G8_9PROT|nr:hypothetical protein [Sneathiella chungangensis]MZR20925.1 hypothetical protein [Sneathiella chungangensis]
MGLLFVTYPIAFHYTIDHGPRRIDAIGAITTGSNREIGVEILMKDQRQLISQKFYWKGDDGTKYPNSSPLNLSKYSRLMTHKNALSFACFVVFAHGRPLNTENPITLRR